jgi:hypothetical protein
MRGLTSAAKSFGFVDEAPTPCEYTGRRWQSTYYERVLRKEVVDVSNKVDK